MLIFFNVILTISTFKIIGNGAIIFWDFGKNENKKTFSKKNCKTDKIELFAVVWVLRC